MTTRWMSDLPTY